MTPPDTKSTKEGLRATLADLTALHGASGFEQPLVKYFQRRVAGLADRVDVDGYGNVTAAKNGRQPHPRLPRRFISRATACRRSVSGWRDATRIRRTRSSI